MCLLVVFRESFSRRKTGINKAHRDATSHVEWPSHMRRDQRRAMCTTLLCESLAELVFLLFGQVGLNDLELLAFDGLSNFVKHSPARQQEQGRGPYCDLVAHLVDKVVVNAIVGKVSSYCPHRGAQRQSEERDKEQQAE